MSESLLLVTVQTPSCCRGGRKSSVEGREAETPWLPEMGLHAPSQEQVRW